MKQLVVAGMIGLAMVVGVCAEEVGGAKRVGLVNLGGFDEPLMGRLAGHLSSNLKSAPRMLAARDLADSDQMQDQAVALAPLVKDDLACVIGIAAMPKEVKQHGAVSPSDDTAVLNATALKPIEGDAEAYARRLESEAMRCAGLLLGMKPCPNPRCALRHYTDEKGLKAKGRNFCPPCQVQFSAKRAELGLHEVKGDGIN